MTKQTRINQLQARAKLLEERGPHNVNIVNKIKRQIRKLEGKD